MFYNLKQLFILNFKNNIACKIDHFLIKQLHIKCYVLSFIENAWIWIALLKRWHYKIGYINVYEGYF